MKTIVLTSFVMAILTMFGVSNVAQADAQTDYPFLYPGFHFDIQPSAEGALSISALYDGEGFILCSSQQDPSNGAVPAPFHCNTRLTPAGFHMTPDALFGKVGFLQKLKSVLESALIVGPQAAAAIAPVPGLSIPGQAVTNVVQQSEAGKAISQYQLSKTMDLVKIYANKDEQDCAATYPTALSPFYMADLSADLQVREKNFEKQCLKYNSAYDLIDPRIAKNQEESFCLQQTLNVNYASNVMTDCNIQTVTPQAGESGSAELWYPGQPVPASCVTKLMQMGLKLEDGTPVLDPTTGWNVQPSGAVLISWLKKQQDQLHGISPATTDSAVAQHVNACLANNPVAAAAQQAQLKAAEAAVSGIHTTPDSKP